ncbi:MAG: ABC transporter permease subunit [Peptococcaceae bacterium]|nr:ABC transporter permease subunit [Peptococcaceae bacterium]
MNMFLHELKAYQKSTITWTLSLVAVVILFFSMFPSISREAEEFTKIIQGYPEALRVALGLSVENIGSILGFYSYIFVYVLLVGAIQAMNIGTSILSKEIREKTADFLLTKPVTRSRIITSKILAALTSIAITNVFFLVTAIAMAALVETKQFNFTIFLLLSFTLFYVQLVFLALGILISVMFSRIRFVLPISLGTVFALFFVGALAANTKDDILRFFSPFKYFDFAYIIQNSRYEFPFILVEIGFIIVAITVSYIIYARKDIHTV